MASVWVTTEHRPRGVVEHRIAIRVAGVKVSLSECEAEELELETRWARKRRRYMVAEETAAAKERDGR